MENIKILLIEDDPIWQIKIQFILEDCGFDMLGVNCLEQVKALGTSINDFHLILSDVVLPDGISYLFFKANPVIIPILFMSEFAERKHLENIVEIPHASFYIKPVHHLTLEAAIKASLKAFYDMESPSVEVPVRYGIKKKVFLYEIMWIEVKLNYVSIKTQEKLYVFKGSFPIILPHLDDRFLRISKSVMVNKVYIDKVNLRLNIVQIESREFEVGKVFRPDFVKSYYES